MDDGGADDDNGDDVDDGGADDDNGDDVDDHGADDDNVMWMTIIH